MTTDMVSRVRRKIENKVDAVLLGKPPSPVNLCWAITVAGSQQRAVPRSSSLGTGQGIPPAAMMQRWSTCFDGKKNPKWVMGASPGIPELREEQVCHRVVFLNRRLRVPVPPEMGLHCSCCC